MSSKRLDAISDYSRHGDMLRVDCKGRKRVAVIDPWQIVQLCQRRQSSRQMQVVERRLRCSQCGSRDVRCGPSFKR
jgi:hypothetical protein